MGLSWQPVEMMCIRPTMTHCATLFPRPRRLYWTDTRACKQTVHPKSTIILHICWQLTMMYQLPSVLWHCWLGVRKSIRPIKIEWWGAGVVSIRSEVQMLCIWSSWCHPIISCFIKIQNGLTFLVPAYRGCPGKETIELVSVYCINFDRQNTVNLALETRRKGPTLHQWGWWLAVDEERMIHWLTESRFYVPLDTKHVILETFPKVISWLGIEKQK